jgi:hypothetical protein
LGNELLDGCGYIDFQFGFTGLMIEWVDFVKIVLMNPVNCSIRSLRAFKTATITRQIIARNIVAGNQSEIERLKKIPYEFNN